MANLPDVPSPADLQIALRTVGLEIRLCRPAGGDFRATAYDSGRLCAQDVGPTAERALFNLLDRLGLVE